MRCTLRDKQCRMLKAQKRYEQSHSGFSTASKERSPHVYLERLYHSLRALYYPLYSHSYYPNYLHLEHKVTNKVVFIANENELTLNYTNAKATKCYINLNTLTHARRKSLTKDSQILKQAYLSPPSQILRGRFAKR